MWLNQLFTTDSPVDFEKRCRLRMKVGVGFMILGAISMVITVMNGTVFPAWAMEEGLGEYLSGFYRSLGIGLMAAGMVIAIRNRNYLRDPELRKKKEIAERDERNVLLGLRCWAYTGYSMFLFLYVAMLVSGFFSRTAVLVLQMVTVAYVVFLFLFRFLLSRSM